MTTSTKVVQSEIDPGQRETEKKQRQKKETEERDGVCWVEGGRCVGRVWVGVGSVCWVRCGMCLRWGLGVGVFVGGWVLVGVDACEV